MFKLFAGSVTTQKFVFSKLEDTAVETLKEC